MIVFVRGGISDYEINDIMTLPKSTQQEIVICGKKIDPYDYLQEILLS